MEKIGTMCKNIKTGKKHRIITQYIKISNSLGEFLLPYEYSLESVGGSLPLRPDKQASWYGDVGNICEGRFLSTHVFYESYGLIKKNPWANHY